MSEPSSSSSAVPQPVNRHAPTATEKQRMSLQKLLKDPAKPVVLPAPPQEKTLRPPREMMKNVQGSSAGAGSGEFHVYKANRRREYERLKMMEETTQKEKETAEFEQRKREREGTADAKTAKNRAKRQKKKELRDTKSKSKGAGDTTAADGGTREDGVSLKKRRLVDGGKEVVFRAPGEESDASGDDQEAPGPSTLAFAEEPQISDGVPSEISVPRMTIVDDDD